MTKNLGVCLTCWVLLGGTSQAADDMAAKVVNEAIRAHGGPENLGRARRMLRTAEGALSLGGGASQFSEELLVDLPNRSRHQLMLRPQGARFLTVVNGERGWQVAGGATQDLGKDRLREVHDDLYLLYLTTLMPLRLEKRFTLKTVADADVQGKKAAGVQVSCKGHEDIRLYFDKGTHLLVKTARQTQVAGLPVNKEVIYADWKEFGGVKLPSTLIETHNGNKYLEIRSARYTFPKPEDRSFAKP
jgi:hypothetical protein